MASNQHQEYGNQCQHSDSEESSSTFLSIIEMGSWGYTTHHDPNFPGSTNWPPNWPSNPDNTYEQMQGDASDLPSCMPASSRDDPIELDDLSNGSIESIKAIIHKVEQKPRYRPGIPQQHMLGGSISSHVPSIVAMPSLSYSGVSGTEGSTTPPSSTGMYADNTAYSMMSQDPNTHNRVSVGGLAKGFHDSVDNAPDAHRFLLPTLPQSGKQETGLYPGYMPDYSFGYDPNILPSTNPRRSDTRSITNSSSTTLSEIRCDVEGCDSIFHGKWRRGNLARHRKQIHKDQANFACQICGKEFRRSDARLKHMRNEHMKKERKHLKTTRAFLHAGPRP